MQNSILQEHITALIVQAKTNPAAFGRLYEHFVQPVYRYLYSRVGSMYVAEDLTSQTFIAAYEALPRYRERGHFSAWLFRIARSRLMDYYRDKKIEIDLDQVERIEGSYLDGDALNDIIQDEELKQIRLLIQHLDFDEQELIRLRFVAELTFPEMAEILGKREDAVRKSLNRLMVRLRSQME